MDKKYTWHYNDEEYMKYSKDSVDYFKNSFDYKSYITPHSDMRELIGKIIEELQYLEQCIKGLLFYANENDIFKVKKNFNFDNFIPAKKTVKDLTDVLIEGKIADKLIELIDFRNYLIHEHYISENRLEMEDKFPWFLFMTYEAVDYISNVTNRIIGGATHIPNIFEVETKKEAD